MEGSTDETCSCCSKCCSWCLCPSKKQEKLKYAGIRYELIPHPTPGKPRSFRHQQHQNPPVILPQDLPRVFESDSSQLHRHQSQLAITQQPKGASSPYSPHRRIIGTAGSASPTSSLSEESPTHALSKLRSVALSPDPGRSDTIDISQSPTGTFSSAYQRSQKRRSYAASATTASSRHSNNRTSSSDEGESDTSSRRVRHVSKTDSSFAYDSDCQPTLKMSFYYHVESETLSVSLHGAENLPPKQSKSYTVVVHLAPKRTDALEMRIVCDDQNPALAQSFEISEVPRDEVRLYEVLVRLHDGTTAGELLGNATIALDKTDLFGMVCSVFLDTHTNKPRGELLLSLSLNPKSSVLQGILLKLASSIITGDRSGPSEIYVKIYLVYKGKRNKHWKSSTKQNNLSVIFNEAFQFDLRNKDVRHAALELCIMHYDRFSKDEVLGRVLIGEGVAHETGRQHWREITAAKSHSRISHWHTFTPHTS